MAAGYKDFTDGAVLTAADLEDYTQNQAVMRFASAAARDTALSAVKTEGMCAYLLDVNTLTVYSGSAWSTIGPVHGALTSWTPAVTQSGSVSVTVNRATYSRVGRRIHAEALLTVTGSGTASNLITVSLPVAIDSGWVSDYTDIGQARISDVSAAINYAVYGVAPHSTTTVKFSSSVSAVPPTFHGAATFTAGLAVGDILALQVSYEAGADA